MTAAAAAGDPGRRHAAAMWLGHYAGELYLSGMALQGVALVSMNLLPEGAQWATTAVVFPYLMLAVVALILQTEVHDRNLCPRDLAQAPLADPEGEVQRRMGWLRRYHGARKRLLLAPVLLIAVMVVALAFPGGRFIQQGALLVFMAFASWRLYIIRIHRRLRPWCPMCRWGRGDDGPKEPSPVTPPANVHTVS